MASAARLAVKVAAIVRSATAVGRLPTAAAPQVPTPVPPNITCTLHIRHICSTAGARCVETIECGYLWKLRALLDHQPAGRSGRHRTDTGRGKWPATVTGPLPTDQRRSATVHHQLCSPARLRRVDIDLGEPQFTAVGKRPVGDPEGSDRAGALQCVVAASDCLTWPEAVLSLRSRLVYFV